MRGAAIALNILLITLFPFAWMAPLMTTSLFRWWGEREHSILSAIAALWEESPGLAALVAFFAVVAPWGKAVALAFVQQGLMRRAALAVLAVLSKLAMADLFAIALLIVASKGIGIGSTQVAWGLWLFVGCILLSILTTQLTAWSRPAAPPASSTAPSIGPARR